MTGAVTAACPSPRDVACPSPCDVPISSAEHVVTGRTWAGQEA